MHAIKFDLLNHLPSSLAECMCNESSKSQHVIINVISVPVTNKNIQLLLSL